ncbi:MAG: glycosyltransferase family 2 protein [Pusillimonas sp.]
MNPHAIRPPPDLSCDARVSICMATYQRREQLARLLQELANQTRTPDQIVIVDNDAQGSARAVVEHFAAEQQGRMDVVYAIQPEKNIALTRNMSVALATGPWLAFIDDDERAPVNWLKTLLSCAETHQAPGVLAPVIPIIPADAPGWIKRGSLYECPRMTTGTVVPLNTMRIGNALLHRSTLDDEPQPFDPSYGVTGGSDSDLLTRLAQKGVRIIWCDEALVDEPVDRKRMTLGWILRRAMRGGQDYARHFLKGRLTGSPPSWTRRLLFFARALLQMGVAGMLAFISLPFGRHHAARWLAKTWANFGKLAVLSGWLYREYA